MDLKTHLTLIYIAVAIVALVVFSIYKMVCHMIENGTHYTVDHTIPKETIIEIADLVLDEIEKRRNVTDDL